jgi:hypothetical protein
VTSSRDTVDRPCIPPTPWPNYLSATGHDGSMSTWGQNLTYDLLEIMCALVAIVLLTEFVGKALRLPYLNKLAFY